MPEHSHRELILQGENYFEQGAYVDALHLFEQVLEAEPEHVHALNDAGITAGELDQARKSVEYFERALAVQPDFEPAFFGLLDVLAERDEVDTAVHAFLRYEEHIPNTADKQQYADLLTERTAPATPHSERIRDAEELLMQDQPREALTILHEVLEQDPDNANALNDAGHAYVDLGEPVEASRCFERALEADPGHRSAFYSLIDLLVRNESPELAVEVFLKYHESLPDDEEKGEYADALGNWADDQIANSITDGRLAGEPHTRHNGHVSVVASPKSEHTTPWDEQSARTAVDRHTRPQGSDSMAAPGTRAPGPIAIGGCGSSGTSLLRRMIDAHPTIFCGKEMSVFDRPLTYSLDIDELRAMYERGEYDELDQAMPFPIRTRAGSYFGLKRGNHGDDYHDTADVERLLRKADTVAEFWNLYFTEAAEKHGKKRWAEKSPNNLFCAAQFLDMYPNGQFIYVLRNGRDVCLSLIKRRKFSPFQAIVRWTMSVEAGNQIKSNDRVYTVRYEDLVRAPEETLTGLFEWLGESYDPVVLDYYLNDETNPFGYGDQPVHEHSSGRWQDEWPTLPESLRNMLDLGLKQHLKTAGYI